VSRMVNLRNSRRTGLAAGFLTLAAALGGVAMTTGAQAADPDTAAQGRQLFTDWGCGACHVLKDAGGGGHVGPALDGNANLSKTFITNRVLNGQGAMPGFAGAMTDEEVAVLADYIVEKAAK
jgi:mono/diheme cytochrome c family protein